MVQNLCLSFQNQQGGIVSKNRLPALYLIKEESGYRRKIRLIEELSHIERRIHFYEESQKQNHIGIYHLQYIK